MPYLPLALKEVHPNRSSRLASNNVVGGRYRILEELGHGGMSVVYRVQDQLHDRQVALKVLKHIDDEPRNLLFLQQEFRAMARLRHPSLVQVFDYGIFDNDSPFFTMELLSGEDLSEVQRLPFDSIFQVLRSIADVLAFMHARGYVHRDVKPSNVRILPTKAGQPIQIKLMDCGLTERLGNRGSTVAGTLAYLAPEAWLGAPADIRTDLYALGVLAYEITTGQLPFDASTGVQLLRTKTERPRDLRESRPDTPVEFARLVGDLLAPEPANRPASAMEVAARLSEFSAIEFHPDPAPYLRAPAFVARSRELDELRGAINRTCSGRPAPIVITGQAGAGKTRLLDEALLEMGIRGAIIARATGRGFAGRSHQVLSELSAPLAHFASTSDLPSVDRRLASLVPKRIPQAADLDHRGSELLATPRELHQALVALIGGISKQRRLVLAIDDIHLADAASLDALTSLLGVTSLSNLAIVATLRTGEPTSQSLDRMLSVSRKLVLDRMSQQQISELIVGALGTVTPSPTLAEELERVTSGNVYFVLEILRDLATRGILERKRTRVLLPDSLDTAQLPKSLTEALERHIALLSGSGRTLARVLSIINRATDFELARSLMDTTDEEFLDAVDELRREELVGVQDRQLVVHHPRLREVLYQDMSVDERRQLHGRAAELISQARGNNGHDNAAELGHHYAEAGNAAKALEHFVEAGDARYQNFAYFDASEVYRRAFELLHAASRSKRRELERKLNDRLGRICFYHDHRRGPKYLEQARHHHLRYGMLWIIPPLSRLLGATIAVGAGVFLTALYNLLRLHRHPLNRAVERLLDSFAATTYLANCYIYSGRSRSALAAADQLLPFVYSRKRMPRVGYLMARVYTLLLMNRFDDAAAGALEALEIVASDQTTPVSEHDRVHAEGGALITLLWVDLTRGHIKDSRWWQPLQTHVERHPTVLLESWLMEAKVFAAFRKGDLAETETAWIEFVEKASQAEVLFVKSKAKTWVGMTYVDFGRTSEALDLADDVIRVGRTRDNPLVLAHGLQLRGLALHGWEQLHDAERCLEEAALITANADVACWELHHSVLLCLAVLALDRGNTELARELATRVEERNAHLVLAHDLHRCRARRILGRVAMAQGELEESLRHLDESFRLASEVDDLLEKARAAHFLAKTHSAKGNHQRADEYRARCAQLLGQAGNNYQLRRLGYAPIAEPDSASGPTVLSRVIQLVSTVDAKSGESQENGLPGLGRPQSQRGSLLETKKAALYEATLVAADSTDSRSGS